jgi:hypothetical protein
MRPPNATRVHPQVVRPPRGFQRGVVPAPTAPYQHIESIDRDAVNPLGAGTLRADTATTCRLAVRCACSSIRFAAPKGHETSRREFLPERPYVIGGAGKVKVDECLLEVQALLGRGRE